MVVLLGDDRSSGFVQKVNESNRQFNTYGLVFGVVLYNLYIFVDMTLVPEIIWLDLVVRLFVITPLLFLYFPARYYATRARPDAIAHEVLHGLGCMLVVASLMFIYANARTSAASEYYMGIITVVLYMNTIHRKPFPLAVMGTVGCMVVFIVGLEYVTVTSEVAKMPAIMCSVGVGVVSLFAAYRIENVERRDYLASVREKTLLQRIQNANRELQQLSNTDQLTGIRNRRSFDEAAGEASDNGGRPRALILLDVDYFKNYTDIPQVACRLTSRSPDFARWASVFRPERCLSSRKRPKSGGSSLEPAAFWPGRAAFPRGRRTCPAAFVQLGHGSWSCA